MNSSIVKPKTSKDYVRLVNTMQTQAEVDVIGRAVQQKYYMYEILPALFERVKTLLLPADLQPVEGNCIYQEGIRYNLIEWLTLSDYANRYNLASTNVVSNWISRGVIPATCVVEFINLNNLKLVKAQTYPVDNQPEKT